MEAAGLSGLLPGATGVCECTGERMRHSIRIRRLGEKARRRVAQQV
jgi:hypothetical protein